MAYRNLDEFVIRLEQSDGIQQVTEPVAPGAALTAAILAARARRSNKALWFDSVGESDFPVVANLFAAPERVAWALGLDEVQQLEHRVENLVNMDLSQGFGGLINQSGEILAALRSAGWRGVLAAGQGESQQVVHTDAPSLDMLPLGVLWPQESAATMPGVTLVLLDSVSGEREVRSVTAVRLAADMLGVPVHHLRHGGGHKFAAAVVLGGDPAAMWAAGVPLPGRMDPYLLAGWVRGKPVPLAHGITQGVTIPADAEIIIEGEIDTGDIRLCGLLAGEDGFYRESVEVAALRITAITHRRDAIFPLHLPSPPPNERHQWLLTAGRFYTPLLRLLLDEINRVYLPAAGMLHHLAVVSIGKRAAGDAQKVMFGLWGMGEFARNKLLVVVDEDVTGTDFLAAARAILQHVDFLRDVIVTRGALPVGDPTASEDGTGGKVGIDATRKRNRAPQSAPPTPDANALRAHLGAGWRIWDNAVLVAGVDVSQHSAEAYFALLEPVCPAHHIILVDAELDLDQPEYVLWHALVSIDWLHDLRIQAVGERSVVRLNAVRRGRGWPDVLKIEPD